MRRVLFAHTSDVYGGMELQVERVLAHLDQQRYVPAFYLPSDARMVPDRLIERVTALGVEIVGDRRPPRRRVPESVDAVVRLADVLRRGRFALVHVNTARPNRPRVPHLAGALARRPVVRTEHLPPDPAELTPEMIAASRRIERLTRVLLTVSDANREDQIRLLGRSPEKLRVLHNGVAVPPARNRETAVAARRALGIDHDLPLLGAVGRLDHQKGLDVAIRALPAVLAAAGPVQLVLAGRGPDEASLGELAELLGVAAHVTFLGYRDDPERVLAALDVGLMPSRYEGFSLTMLEMMAAGLPCVFSDHPSFVEATDGGSVARLVPIEDHVALAGAIAELLADPGGAAELGGQARAHVVAEFAIDRHAERLMALYDELLDGRRQ